MSAIIIERFRFAKEKSENIEFRTGEGEDQRYLGRLRVRDSDLDSFRDQFPALADTIAESNVRESSQFTEPDIRPRDPLAPKKEAAPKAAKKPAKTAPSAQRRAPKK